MNKREIKKLFVRDTFLAWLDRQTKGKEWCQHDCGHCVLAMFSGKHITGILATPAKLWIDERQLPEWAYRVSRMRSIKWDVEKPNWFGAGDIRRAVLDQDPCGRFKYKPIPTW